MAIKDYMRELRSGYFGDPVMAGVRSFNDSGSYPLGDTAAVRFGRDLPSFLSGFCQELAAQGLERVEISPKYMEAVSIRSDRIDSESADDLAQYDAAVLDYSRYDIFEKLKVAESPVIMLDAKKWALTFRFEDGGPFMQCSVPLSALMKCAESAQADGEKAALARYGLESPYESVREYAGIELAESESGIDLVMADIDEAIAAAESADDGWTLNPWFSDRQAAVISVYMDGQFGTELLTAETDPRQRVYECDALLAHLVAACDPDFSDWRERLDGIRRQAGNPLPESAIRDCAAVSAKREKARSGPKM